MESQTPPRTPKRFIPAGQQKPATVTPPAASTPKQPGDPKQLSAPKQPDRAKSPSPPQMGIPSRPGLKFDPKQRMSEYKGHGLSDFESAALTYHDVYGTHDPDLHSHSPQNPSPAFLERVRGAAQKIVDHHHSQKASEGGISDLPFKATHHHIHQEITPELEAAHGKISDLSQEMDPFERMLAIGNTVSGHIGSKLSDVGDKYRDAKIASMGNQVLLHNMISGQSGSHDPSGDVSAMQDLSGGAKSEKGGNVGFSVSTDPRTAKIGAISQNPEARKRSLERAAHLKGQITEDQARQSVKRLSERKQQLLADLNLSNEEKRDLNLFMAHYAPTIQQVQRGKRGFRVEGEGKDINDYHAMSHALLGYDPSKGDFGKYFASNLGRGVRNIVSGGSDTAGLPKKLLRQYTVKPSTAVKPSAEATSRVESKPAASSPRSAQAQASTAPAASVPTSAPAQPSVEDIDAQIAALMKQKEAMQAKAGQKPQAEVPKKKERTPEEEAELKALMESQDSDEDYIMTPKKGKNEDSEDEDSEDEDEDEDAAYIRESQKGNKKDDDSDEDEDEDGQSYEEDDEDEDEDEEGSYDPWEDR